MVSPALGTAATLGLTVGAGYVFGPAGAVAGALLGGFLFGSGGAKVEGPRLGDLTVGASTYGNVIPIAYATQKIAGTIIWAPEIDEVKSTGKVGGGLLGGLFGGGQKVTEYRYYASFAVAFAEGPATGLVRLWAGDKLIADLQAPDFSEDLADGAASMRFYRQNSRYKFRFYRGTSTQQPDPLIRRQVEDELDESHITPGFRDIVYIVFDRLALDEFGNRVPPITAEIAFDSDSELPERTLTSIAPEDGGIFPNTQTSLSPAAIDWERGYIYLYRVGNTLQGLVPGIRRYRVLDGVEDLQVHEADILTTSGGSTRCQPECVDHDGNLYCRGATNTIRKVSGDTLREIDRHSSTSPTLHTHIKMAPVSAYTMYGRETFLITRGGLLDTDVIGVMNTNGMLYVYDETVAGVTDIIDVVGGIEALGYGEAWAVARTGGTSVQIIHVRIDALAAFVIGTTVGISRQDFTVAVADIDATATSINDLSAPAYDIDDDAVIFSVRLDSSNGPCRMVKYSVGEGIVWSIPIPSTVAMPARTRFSRGVIGIHFDDGSGPTDGRIFLVDTALGEVIYSRIGWDHDAGGWQFWHDLSGQIFKVASHLQMFPERVSRSTVALASIVTSLCARVGLDTDDIDVTELTDGVQGFGIARQITIRGALELLAAAYNFDCAESDHKLRFKKRGRASTRTIAEAELAPVNNQGEIFVETRAQDIDLPLRFTVRYNDSERDADVATQTAKRIAAPTATMRSANEATLDLPITLTPTQAKNTALRQCFGPWAERTGHQWKLPWTHLDLDPGDVVIFALNSGRSYVVRILEQAIGADLSIEMQTVTEQSASYDVDAVTSGGLIFRRPIASPSSASRLIIADVPLLSDGDDNQRLSSGLYWAMGGLGQPAWPGATLFQSDEGAWALFDEATAEMAWGLASNALGDTDAPFQTDRTNSLTVRMLTGASRLATVTELEMLNGANQALLIDPGGSVEIIQFATVTANADGSHTLGTLLRGRRGTEGFTGGHSVGTVFVLIEDETINRLPVPLTALDAARSYRAVGRGDALRDAANTPITPVGRDLMPYAPVQIAASGSWGSDITLSWQRRTRIGGELVDGGGDVPLAEDSEAYDLEILFGATVVRTVEDLTARSYVYSAADQASDFSGYIAQPLVNPGFETGDLTGWTTELDGTLMVDDAHESLTAAHGGTCFLRSTADSRIAQTVDIAFAAQQIDVGDATARARCWIAATAGDTDTARVALQFLDANDVELGVVEPSFTNPTGQTFVQIEAEGAISAGTRRIKVRVAIDRVSGATANVAVDDVTLEIDPGELRSLTVAAWQISGQVGRGFRGLRTVDVV